MHRRFLGLSAAVAALAVFAAMPFAASASHSWANYHWARTSNPFTLQLGDNVSSMWDSYLATTSSDWSKSTVLDTTIVTGGAGTAKRCNATTGRVEVCNTTYGRNGWLGVAQIWASGDHIVQGTVKLNDTYFNTSTYNTPAWRNLVMCQEVGHTFGLAHQDEVFTNPNLGTCMDYTNNPSTNQQPNAHDYDQLAAIYAHLDSTTTVASMPASLQNGDFAAANSWGKLVSSAAAGQSQTFEREFAGGFRLVTHVFWVSPH